MNKNSYTPFMTNHHMTRINRNEVLKYYIQKVKGSSTLCADCIDILSCRVEDLSEASTF